MGPQGICDSPIVPHQAGSLGAWDSEDRESRHREGGAGTSAPGHRGLDAYPWLLDFPVELRHLLSGSSFNPSRYQLLGKSPAQSPSWQNLPMNSTKRTKSSPRVTQLSRGTSWQGRAGRKARARRVKTPGLGGWAQLPGSWPARDRAPGV